MDALFLSDMFKDQVGQFFGSIDRPVVHNRARNFTREAFLAITENNIGKFGLGSGIHQISGGERGLRGETHIERPVMEKGETSLRCISCIEETPNPELSHPRFPAQVRRFSLHRRVRGLDNVGALSKGCQPFAAMQAPAGQDRCQELRHPGRFRPNPAECPLRPGPIDIAPSRLGPQCGYNGL